MAAMLQIEIEQPGRLNDIGYTKESLRQDIEDIFIELGIAQSVVRIEITGVELREERQLVPGLAEITLVVAIIGIGIQLIQLGVDVTKLGQEEELEREKITLEREKLDFEKQKYEKEKASHSDTAQELTKEEIRVFVDDVLLPRLIERQKLQISSSKLRITQEKQD